MVKFFTNNESIAYEEEKTQRQFTEDQFEQALRVSLQKLTKSPSEKTISTILDYSRSLSKQD